MSVNSHLACMRNAFSTACAGPKVPDGRVSASLAMKEAACEVYVFPAGVNKVIFCLMPGLRVGLSIYPIATTTTGTPPVVTTTLQAGAFLHTGIEGTSFTSVAQEAPDKFRLVSGGLRLSAVNAAEYNNGWFEAIRVDSRIRPTDWVTLNGGSTPATGFENGLLTSSNWCNHPSYVTGRLSNLYKHQFNLQNINNRDFISANANATANANYDDGFDIVLVRISSVATTTIQPAIHYHMCANWETVYDAGTQGSKWHSPCLAAEGLVKKVDQAIKRDPKASIIRSPNSFAYQP
jgi:hypothetical protein